MEIIICLLLLFKVSAILCSLGLYDQLCGLFIYLFYLAHYPVHVIIGGRVTSATIYLVPS